MCSEPEGVEEGVPPNQPDPTIHQEFALIQ
jgi:hypothetical protein